MRHRHRALLRPGGRLPLGGDQGPDPHHAPLVRTHRQQPRGHVEGADRRPDARERPGGGDLRQDQRDARLEGLHGSRPGARHARPPLRHDRRGRQEPVKSQLRRINSNPSTSTRASVLYLTILNETKTMVLQSRNLLKSQHYFLESQHEIAPSRQ